MILSPPLPIVLALRELRHEWEAALCFIMALVGILTPLLVILALKNGVIDRIVAGLIEDPRNRELIVLGAGHYTPDFLAAIAADPDTGFLVPATRSINTVANAVRLANQRGLERDVSLVATAEGDPLLPGPAPEAGAAYASAALANALDLKPGDTVEIVISRDLAGTLQSAQAPLRILGVLPAVAYGQSALFVAAPNLLSVERFRDERSMAPEELARPAPPRDAYPSFRVYAASLDRVSALRETLASKGVRTRPRAENAPRLLELRDDLGILFAVIAVLALGGLWAATAANLRGMVARQRTSLSLMRLLGMGTTGIRALPLAQALILTGAGILVSLAIVSPTLAAMNAAIATRTDAPAAAVLGWQDIAGLLGLGLVVAVTAPIWALRAAGRISAEEVVRHA